MEQPPPDDAAFPSHLPRLVLDLETYYASDYNLNKLTSIP